ncbi:hypothetical protein [Persephonella sp.]
MKKFLFGLSLIFFFQYFFYIKGLFFIYVFNKVIFTLIAISISYMIFLYFFQRNKLYPYTTFSLLWFLILLISSSIAANINFNQPILLGLIAEIKIFPIFFFFFLIFLLKKVRFSIKTIENIFISVGTISLIIFYLVGLFFKDLFLGSEIIKFDLVRGFRLNMPMSIVIITFFIYLYKFILTRNLVYLIFPFMTLNFLIFFAKSRMITFGLSIILLLSILKEIKKTYLKILILAIALIILILFLSKIDIKSVIYNSSMLIRLDSIEKSVSFLFSENKILHIFIGAGGLNPIFFKSFQDIFGENFWPSDIGLIGVFFEFGIIGIIFYISFWIVLIKEIMKAKKLYGNYIPIINAFKSYVILSIILSPFIPMILYQLGVFSSMLGILVYFNYYYYKRYQRK